MKKWIQVCETQKHEEKNQVNIITAFNLPHQSSHTLNAPHTCLHVFLLLYLKKLK